MRELENLVRRAVAVHVSDEIGSDIITQELATFDGEGARPASTGPQDMTQV